jgi:chaperonin cofactor prefoldin
MDSETIDVVTGWDSVPVGDGYRGLHDLADREFSGAVDCGSAWAFVLNGRVVGVFDGSIDDFEDADLTAYVAPDSALPLLFAMRERGGETRAKYYTNDTPLSEAHETLSSGSFTGYVELSENVLSGDYYVVYYGGKSMSAAFVGNSRRLLTGDEAFERANDEVGIYHVRQVDIEIVDVPDVETQSDVAAVDDDGTAETDDERTFDGESDDAVQIGETRDDTDAAGERTPTETEAHPATETPTDPETPTETGETAGEEQTDETARTADRSDEPASDARVHGPRTRTPEAGDRPEDESSEERSGAGGDTGAREEDERAREETDAHGPDRPPAGRTAQPSTERPTGDAAEQRDQEWVEDFPDEENGTSANGDEDVFTEEAKWREARAIPALDPDDTTPTIEESESSARSKKRSRSRSESRATGQSDAGPKRGPSTRAAGPGGARGGASGDRTGRSAEAPQQLRERLEAVLEERNELRSRLEQVDAARERMESERDELRRERDELKQRADTLEARVGELEREVDRLESELESVTSDSIDGETGGRTMSPSKALEGTNLFIRYDRKSQGTLEAAHAGQATREEVNQNLRIDFHTTFDRTDLTVDGSPYEEFLRDTLEFGFVEWIVRELLYEIRETNNEHNLEVLYDAIPQIDRVELRGSVSGSSAEEGDPESRGFDVIIWDGMGDPLVVANLHDSRTAATETMVSSLVENATWVAEQNESLGGACFVTSSFFEPESLEVVSSATGSGILSRSKRKAFVKLSRKSGFHVCLVEGRNEEFYVNFPDL